MNGVSQMTMASTLASDAAPTLQDRLVIEDPAALKAISDPLRLRLLELLTGEPHTVKYLAQVVGVRPNRLYYHVRMLEEHGLVQVTGTRLVSGIVERHYQATARSFVLGPSLASGVGVASGMVHHVLDMTRRELDAYMAARPEPTDDDDRVMLGRHQLRLTPARRRELTERIDALFEEFGGADEPASGGAPDTVKLAALVALYPVVDEA